jgi:tRNA(His) 5'-end guanylyltransferase
LHAALFAHLLLCVWCHANHTGRRASKIISTITSCFSGNYVRLWPQFFPDTPLRYTPVFDGRAVCYPSLKVLKDYLAWRQADTHINNQVGDRLSRLLVVSYSLV